MILRPGDLSRRWSRETEDRRPKTEDRRPGPRTRNPEPGTRNLKPDYRLLFNRPFPAPNIAPASSFI
jgi:hypothetical protein